MTKRAGISSQGWLVIAMRSWESCSKVPQLTAGG